MTPKEELIYANEEIRLLKTELEGYNYCLKLCIEIISGVCDGNITLEQMKNFRNNMESLGGQIH